MVSFWKTLSGVQARLVLALPIAMVAGGLVGYFFDATLLRAFLLPLTFALVLPMMVSFDFRSLLTKSHLKLHLSAQALNFAVFPLLAWGLGLVAFPGQPALQAGLLLAALLPTSGMTVSWTGMAKGNVPEAVRMTLLGLLLGSLATPFYLQGLLGREIALPVVDTLLQIGLVIGLPLLLGQAIRWLALRSQPAPEFDKMWKPRLGSVSTVFVLLMVFSALALKSRSLVSDPFLLWQTFWPVAVFYLANFVLSTLVGRLFFERAEAFTLVYGTVMRNLSLALALALGLMGDQGGAAALVITWAYILQVQGAAWYLKLAPRFFR